MSSADCGENTWRHPVVDGGSGPPGALPPPADPQDDTDASTGPHPTEVPVAVKPPSAAVAGSEQRAAEPEQHPGITGNPCVKDVKSPLLIDSCAVPSTASTIPSHTSPQSVNEVKRNEDMSASPVSDIPCKVMSRSSERGGVTDGSTLTSDTSSRSHRSVECGQTEAESCTHLLGETPHGTLRADESSVTDKSSGSDKQSLGDILPNKKETVSGETPGDAGEGAVKTSTSSTDSDEEKQSIYHVKWIKHKNTTMPIITQNENGPCPLLAIMNLLLLQSKIKLPSGAEVVTSNELMAHLADWIFEHVPKNISEDTRLNYEQNMQDAIAVFPRLQTGLDVNVRFTGVSQFEYTPECIVFDLLDIPLYHGWLVDPQMPDLVSAIGNSTYNQLVEKIIIQKNSNKEELVAEAILAEEFLNVTASQLTYHGLSELSATTKEEEMCVLFRNNHFSTLYKHKNELFVLVTDQGFLRESNVVWETLSNIEGDGHFVDSEFRTYRLPEASTAPLPTPSFPVNSKEQIDHDYLVALSLEQEQSEVQPGATWSGSTTLSDHELALRLQEEENLNAEGASRQQATPRQQKPDAPAAAGSNLNSTGSGSSSSSVPGKEKKESSCSVM